MGYYFIKKLIGFSSKKISPNGYRAIVPGSHRMLESIRTTIITIAIAYLDTLGAKLSVTYFTHTTSLTPVGSHIN